MTSPTKRAYRRTWIVEIITGKLGFVNEKNLPKSPNQKFEVCEKSCNAMEYTMEEANAWVEYISTHDEYKGCIATTDVIQYYMNKPVVNPYKNMDTEELTKCVSEAVRNRDGSLFADIILKVLNEDPRLEEPYLNLDELHATPDGGDYMISFFGMIRPLDDDTMKFLDSVLYTNETWNARRNKMYKGKLREITYELYEELKKGSSYLMPLNLIRLTEKLNRFLNVEKTWDFTTPATSFIEREQQMIDNQVNYATESKLK